MEKEYCMTKIRAKSRLVAVLMSLLVMGSMGMALGGPAVSAQDTASCWNEDPNGAAGYPQWSTAPNMVIDTSKTYQATLETNMGDIVIDLYADKAPTTVNNFVCLANAGYYDIILFHRIIANFMIQTGDPTATGTGGPGYQFADELPGDDLKYEAGTVAMANSGPNTNGSQFFIVHGDGGSSLQPNYTIFGKVSAGMDVVDAIATSPVGPSTRGEQSMPQSHIGFKTITISEK